MTKIRRIAQSLALFVLCEGCGSESQSREASLRREATTTSPTPTPTPPPPPSAREQLLAQPLQWNHSPMMRGLQRLTSKMQSSAYVHGIDVDTRRGHYGFDCSGMVEWVLRDSAPQAYRNLRRPLAYRPLARDFVFHLARLAPDAEGGGWKRIARVTDAQPGDVVAWIKPKFVKSENTGHVAVIVQEPRLRSPYDTAYLVRVADSSRLRHEDDSRGGRGGYGYGTILIETNPNTGAPSGFSFAGSRAEHAFGTKVVIGRPMK